MTLPGCLLLVAGMVPATPARPVDMSGCDIPGEVIQWAADHCMLKAQTDDEIAVSECIGEWIKRKPGEDCAAKRRIKQAMCEYEAGGGDSRAGVDQCVTNPDFMGGTVRRGGVGQ